MSFNDDITKLILEKRNVKESSLKAYLLNLNKILKLEGLEATVSNLNKTLEDSEEVMNILKDKKASTIRNYLASIVVYLSLNEKNSELVKTYRELMDKYQKENNEGLENNQKSESQKKNWSSLKELQDIVKSYKKELDRTGALKKDKLSKKDFDTLQKYVVGSLYIGDPENPPLRNDYIMNIIFKSQYDELTEEEKKRLNYLVIVNRSNKFFSLGEYKTSDKFGIKEIKVGKILNRILNIWLKYNESPYLILNSKGEKITPNSLTKLLTKIFEPTGKNISSSMLRHIFITEKFPPQTEEKIELANSMLHSVGVQGSVYAKVE
jgi:site-specific recombinase XerD